jgi:hypothetical protein
MKHNVAIPVSQFKLVDNKFVLPGATKEALLLIVDDNSDTARFGLSSHITPLYRAAAARALGKEIRRA